MAQQTALRANNRMLNLIGGIFFGIGVLLLAIGGLLGWHEHRFSARAQKAQGEVVEITQQLDDKRQRMYGTRVAFQTADGQLVTFESSLRSSSPQYRQGEPVTVQYDPAKPDEARIDSAMEHWFGPALLGGLGLVFGLIGALMLYFNYRTSLRFRRLAQEGQRVQATIVEVGINTSVEINGRSPWRIVCQWQDPRSGKVWLFNSANLWFDPSPFITREQIGVLLDPANPRQHVVDTSFLPEAA